MPRKQRALIAGPTIWPFLLALYWVWYLFLGARIPVAEGLGWDGQIYGALAADFFGFLHRNGIAAYSTNRLFPSFVVWVGAKLAGFELSGPDRIVFAFHVFNGVLLLAGAWVWQRIARSAALGPSARTLGFIALFMNWAVLKEYGYAAVQTDTTALFLGILVAWATVKRYWVAQIAIAFIGAFVWNTVFPLCALLVALPYPAPALPGSVWWSLAASVLATSVAAVVALTGPQLLYGAAQISMSALPLSLAVLAVYVAWVARALAPLPLLWPPRFFVSRIIAIIVAWAVSAAALSVIREAVGVDSFSIWSLLGPTVGSSVAKPGVFLIAAIAFFGPAFALALWTLPAVLRAAAANSAGAALFLLITLAMMTCSESRQVTFGYPMLVTFLCVAHRDIEPGRATMVAFIGASLVLSKVWLPLGVLAPAERWQPDRLLEYPQQWLLMNIGPWMSWTGYWLNLALIVGLGCWTWFNAGREQRTRVTPPDHWV